MKWVSLCLPTRHSLDTVSNRNVLLIAVEVEKFKVKEPLAGRRLLSESQVVGEGKSPLLSLLTLALIWT